MTEIELHNPAVTPLSEVMDYAKAVASASMLPENYRGKPADIMLAVGLGSAMGLSPAESLYRISVIKGKPTASAELIAANVRKAGHRLRVVGNDETCTATIIRADDPDFEFTVTRDLAWARGMGLADSPNYKKQPGTMLQWRAITAVARLACPEALYGVQYTADEVPDDGPERATSQATTGAERMKAVLTPSERVLTGEAMPVDEPAESPLLDTSGKLAKHMFALFGEAGISNKDDRLKYVSDVVGRDVGSSTDMTDADAFAVIDALRADLDGAA